MTPRLLPRALSTTEVTKIVFQHLEGGTGAAKFKVTLTILDRAELVLGFSVQTRVGGLQG